MSTPPLTGRVATVVGAIGTALASVSPALPAPWATPVAILGFLAASLAGLSLPPPSVTDGKPLLQGTLLAAATGAVGLLQTYLNVIPTGWPQSMALGIGAALAFLTGGAMPHLGASSAVVLTAPTSATPNEVKP